MNWINLNAELMARRPGPRVQLRLGGRPCNAISDKVNSPIPDATCMQEFKSSVATGELGYTGTKAATGSQLNACASMN